MFKFLFIICILLSNNYASQKHDYLLEHYKKKYPYNKDTSKQYQKFIKAFNTSLKEYKTNISKYWEKQIITSPHKYVKYSNNFKRRTIVDYKKNKIIIEVITKDVKLAQTVINKLYNNLFNLTNQMAFRDELVLRNTYRKLDIVFDTPINNELLIGEFLSDSYKEKVLNESILQEYQENKYKDYIYYSSSYNLPDDFSKNIQNRYIKTIIEYEKLYKLPKNILYAIIKVKTSFNPYALTTDAKFGFMLINSKEIGLEAYYKLYKDKRILDAAYLYNFKNNIKIGSTYLDIIYNDKLKNIKNKKSRGYLSIIAYEIGVKDTLDLFDNIEEINTKTSAEIYRQIIKKTKNRNLRIYFTKVARLML